MADRKMGTITRVRPADEDHQVITVEGGGDGGYMRRPCPDCPWRKDAVGKFPAEAFRHSAPTCYETIEQTMIWSTTGERPASFGCHSSNMDYPSTCAGFLLSADAPHNLSLRISRREIDIDRVSDDGLDLFQHYRDMAVANGLPADDPVLERCVHSAEGAKEQIERRRAEHLALSELLTERELEAGD